MAARSKRRDRTLVVSLCRWFRRGARDLPWRRRRNGYTALVAEAMLQQTQVARVVERYQEFMRRFPSVRRLAEAEEQEVLAQWQGMGYYRRARNLHAAARMIVEEFGGRVPREARELQRLPGVGRCTAGSIASIVYGKREPVVDGNVQRVLARLEGKRARHQGSKLMEWAWGRAAELVEMAEEPGVLNEGLMELGARVCTPKGPRCSRCPVSAYCRAYRSGLQEEIPGPQMAIERQRVHHHAVVIRRGACVLLERRPSNGMWSRMWQVPTVEAGRRLRVHEIRKRLPAGVSGLSKLGEFEYGTTHRKIRFHVWTARSRSRKGVWRRADNVGDLPMSNAQRRVLELALGDGERESR